MTARSSAITIDVDSLRFYREIHGLPPAPIEDDPIYTVAMPRFWELIDEMRRPPTLFLIGEDAPRHPAAFEAAKAVGAEIGNHSFAHDYRLTTRSSADIRADLSRAHEALLPLSPDARITGFRAPGYNVSPALLAVVKELGYRYDSSLLPSPLYFGLRAAAIAMYRVLGRPSRSLTGELRAFSGTQAPHPIDADLIELPITCEPLTRAPLFGTSWVVASDRLRRFMLNSALKRLDLINFEMHGIDLLDSTDRGVPPELAASQRDLKVPVREKMRAFRQLFRELAEHTDVRTLGTLAVEGALS
jgi:hypothetical protein